MALETSGPGSLLYQTWAELTRAGGRPPIVRRLPLDGLTAGTQASIRIESAFGYFLCCAIITNDTGTLPTVASVVAGNRNITPGLVPFRSVFSLIGTGEPAYGWYRPIVLRPNDLLTVQTDAALGAGLQAVAVGMYPGIGWEPPCIDVEMPNGKIRRQDYLEQVWLQFAFDSASTDLTRQIEIPWNGVLYDVLTSVPFGSPALGTSTVTMFIDNTKNPLSEAPILNALLDVVNRRPNATQSLLYPVEKNMKFIMDLRRLTVTMEPRYTVRAGKPWSWSG